MRPKLRNWRGTEALRADQLAVRGSETLRNPRVKRTVAEMLNGLIEPAIKVLAEAMDATKSESFVTKDGEIISSQPEPDHGTRLRAVALLFRARGQAPIPPTPADQHPDDVSQSQQDQPSGEKPKEVAHGSGRPDAIPQSG